VIIKKRKSLGLTDLLIYSVSCHMMLGCMPAGARSEGLGTEIRLGNGIPMIVCLLLQVELHLCLDKGWLQVSIIVWCLIRVGNLIIKQEKVACIMENLNFEDFTCSCIF